MKCKHDNSRFCGAGWRNNVFKLVKKEVKKEEFKYTAIYGETWMGCYKDSGNRDLPTLIRAGYGNPSKCFKMAQD
jgi:CRISPR/Cas system endoribonuclease Cas6 (RAMP superfamily)